MMEIYVHRKPFLGYTSYSTCTESITCGKLQDAYHNRAGTRFWMYLRSSGKKKLSPKTRKVHLFQMQWHTLVISNEVFFRTVSRWKVLMNVQKALQSFILLLTATMYKHRKLKRKSSLTWFYKKYFSIRMSVRSYYNKKKLIFA